MLQSVNVEELLEKLQVDVFPVTLVKLLLMKKKLNELEDKVKMGNFESNSTLENDQCVTCKEKQKEGILKCRVHTSIERCLDNSNTILYDSDTKFYIVKNEIFKIIDNKLFIAYCPHTKLIPYYSDKNVRKIKPIVIDYNDPIPTYNTKIIQSSVLGNSNLKCWFNEDFSIVTLPGRNQINFCFVCNKQK